MSLNSHEMLRLMALIKNSVRKKVVIKSILTPTLTDPASGQSAYGSGCINSGSSAKLILTIDQKEIARSVVYHPYWLEPILLSSIQLVMYRFQNESGDIRSEQFKEHPNRFINELDTQYPKYCNSSWERVFFAYPNGVGTDSYALRRLRDKMLNESLPSLPQRRVVYNWAI